MQQNKYHSYNLKQLPKGCQYCVRGEKLVLFVTGVCPRQCSFCPLSDAKYKKDVTFANELQVKSGEDILTEAKNMQAKGAGITGGDPLARLARTLTYIKTLKHHFGAAFHTHLYTSLNLVTKENLAHLHAAGLDEIRFHPDLTDKTFWKNLPLARTYPWDVGIEIPVIPCKKAATLALLSYAHPHIDFINLNELEMADNSTSQLRALGFHVKNTTSYAIHGSEPLGIALLTHIKQQYPHLPAHFCTAQLKDAVQLGNRIKREGKNIQRSFDTVNKEGLLTRGALYPKELVPSFGYRKKLEETNTQPILKELTKTRVLLQHLLHIPPTKIAVDTHKPRILLPATLVRKHKNIFRKIGLVPAIVSEYPTADQLEIEIDFLT